MSNISSSTAKRYRGVKTVSLLGGSELLTQDGDIRTLEDLAGNYREAVKVAFRAPHGRVKFKTIRNLRPSEVTVSEVTKIFLSNGHVLFGTEYDKYATSEDRLVHVSELVVDDTISVLCYNPRTKFLSTTLAKIETLYVSRLSRGPEFLYDLDYSSEDCLPLLSSRGSEGDINCVTYSSSLLPIFD